jgi:hypothetical protein
MNRTIKLFKGLEVENKKKKKPSKEFLEECLKYGVIFSPTVIANYENELELLTIARDIGLSSKDMNNSFHKSWNKVKNTPMEKLLMEQIVHYFTTYGLESVGAYSKDTIFIPAEELSVVKNEMEFIIIKGYTREELKEKLLTLLETGVALSQETVDDCVALGVEYKLDSLDRINNKEVRVALGMKLSLIPSDPIEFLRFLVYVSTKKTLLIKDKATIKAIKDSNSLDATVFLTMYDDKFGLDKLSVIFHRFKPLFLAFKYSKEGKTLVNRLRKYAITNHKPMKEDFLNSITHLKTVDKTKLKNELDKANIFRKIRLAYALKFRLKEDNTSIMYRIRNGKAYSKEFNNHKQASAQILYNTVVESIVNDIKANVKGKKIYIPDYVTYALPSSEKMFSGDSIPSGTFITIQNDMIVGIHWTDVNTHRIDLDLSLVSIDGKIGWDRNYRNESGTILFSGDMTAAPKPNGASEFMYVKRQAKSTHLLNLNYFNYVKEIEVPFQIVIAKEKVNDFKENYMINPNNIVCMTNTKINQKQKILGLLISTIEESRFYFCETYMGDKISSGTADHEMHSKNYLVNYYQNTINLNDVLVKAGAKLVEKDKCEIDLSPNALQKDTIINLIANKK